MGDWGKVLEVISSENAETAAEDEAAGTADPSDKRLFLKEEGWDGPKYLRYDLLCRMSLVQLLFCSSLTGLHSVIEGSAAGCIQVNSSSKLYTGVQQPISSLCIEGAQCCLGSTNHNLREKRPRCIPSDTETRLRRSFVRACLFQPGEHQRLDSLVGSAAGDAGRTSALERAAPVELAVHAASSGSWDRRASRLVSRVQEQHTAQTCKFWPSRQCPSGSLRGPGLPGTAEYQKICNPAYECTLLWKPSRAGSQLAPGTHRDSTALSRGTALWTEPSSITSPSPRCPGYAEQGKRLSLASTESM